MAFLKQAKTEDEIKSLTIAKVKKEYNSLAVDYNKVINLDYVYCPHCGDWKSASAFYTSSKTRSGIEHFGCKACILDMCTDYEKKTGIRTDNRDKTIETFRKLDWVFVENDYKSQLQSLSESTGEKIRSTAVQQLIVMIRSLPQYRNKTFKDSEFDVSDLENNTEENTKIVQKTLKAAKKRFGVGYSNEDLMFLENEYQDWVTRYECNTKAQEAIFERLAFKKWEINKATKDGKPTKDLDKTYTELLTTANVTPRQNVGNAFTESLTFGQLIERWEESLPVPDPDPEFADVNNIGKFIRVWFKGALMRALNLDGGYNEEYDEYIKQYSVQKPEDIASDDDASDDAFDKIFGMESD